MVRGRVAATVDPSVEKAVKLEQFFREKIAVDTNQDKPIYAHTVEDLLKKGLKVCQTERDIIRRQ